MKPPRVTGDPTAVLGDHVNRLIRKFEYPDSDTLPLNPIIGGGGGMMTVAVAASNASGMSQGKADFVCNGTDDHVFIMQAIDICYAAGGGTVWLSEGRFNIDGDQIIVGGSIADPEPMTLRGMGMNSTRLSIFGSTNWELYVADGCEAYDFNIRGISS